MAGGANTSRSSGGKIVTQNAELLSLLIERTQSNMADNSPLEKIYVDSPAYEEDDDDKYRYVSTNVDDFDETQMSAFLMDKTPLDQLVDSTAAHQDDDDDGGRQTPTGYAGTQRVKSNQFRFGDVEDEDEELRKEQEYQNGMLQRLAKQNQDDQKFLIPKLDLSDEEDNPQDSLDPTLGGYGKIHEISVRDSLDVDEKQDQASLRLLMDDADPQGFKVLIGDNLHKPSRDNTVLSNPYKIDLNELRETPVPQHKPVSQPIQHSDDPRLRNLFQEQQQHPQQYASPVHGPPSPIQTPNYEAHPEHHYGPPPAPYQLQPPNSQVLLNSQNGQYEEGYRLTQQSQQLSPHPNGAGPSRVTTSTTHHWPQGLQSHNSHVQEFPQYPASQNDNHHPGSRAAYGHYQGQQPVQQQQYYQEQEYQQQRQLQEQQLQQHQQQQLQQLYQQGPPPLPQEGYENQTPQHQYNDQQYYNNPNQVYQNQPQVYQNQPQLYQNQQQVYQNQPQVYQNQHAPQFGHISQRTPQGFNPAIDQATFRHPAPNQHPQYNREIDEQSGGSSPTLSEMQKSPKNKPKIDFLSRNKKDYAKALPAAKNSYSKAYSDRKKVKENLPPPAPAQGAKRGPVRAKHPPQLKRDDSNETFIVEDTKPGTAETMWSKRTQTLAQTRKNPGSGSKKGKHGPLKKYPSESRVDQMKTINSAPSKLIPIKGSPRQAFTEPLRSEVVMDPNQAGGKPLRHTVFTDDGQRVSVDINLNLSPGNYAQAPFYQGGYQPHPQGPPQQMLPQQMPPPPQSIRSVAPYQPPIGHIPQDNGYYYQQPPPQDNGYYYQPPLPQYQGQYQQYQQQGPEDYEQFSHQQGHQQGQPVDHRSSPLSQRSGQAPSPIGSPFKVLPPIGSADSNRRDTARQEGSQPGTSGRKPKKSRPPPPPKEDVLPPKDNSSYLETMRRVKDRKPVEFKQYTVEDYKKLKREVRLGGLGPDLDSGVLKERREKRERQVEYAKHINMKNKKDLENAPKVAPKPTPEELEAENDLLHRRRVALEYAKSVPKPKVRPPGERKDSAPAGQVSTPVPKMTTTTIRPSNNNKPAAATGNDPDMLDLDTLRRRHEEEKQQAALIRQQVQPANT